MDILDDMGVSKLSEKVFFKVKLLLKYKYLVLIVSDFFLIKSQSVQRLLKALLKLYKKCMRDY